MIKSSFAIYDSTGTCLFSDLWPTNFVRNVDNIEEMMLVIDALDDPIEQNYLRRYITNLLRMRIEEENEVE